MIARTPPGGAPTPLSRPVSHPADEVGDPVRGGQRGEVAEDGTLYRPAERVGTVGMLPVRR